MRTILTLLAALCLLSFSSLAQVKVFSDGSTIVGSTNIPLSGAALQITGRTYFSTATGTVTATSAPYIRSASGFSSASSPDYTWYKDSTSGFFHPSAGILSVSTSGTERFRFNGDQLLSTISFSTGSAPEYSWNSDPNTGLYHPADDNIGFVVGGNEKMRLSSNGQILNGNSSSSVASPDFSWSTDSNTGLYHPASDNIAFATGGTERIRINASGDMGLGTTSPSAKLDVLGTFNLNGWTDLLMDWTGPSGSVDLYPSTSWYLQLGKSGNFIGDAYITHELYIVAPSAYSDSRLKTNINYELNTLGKLKQLKPAAYNFNETLFTSLPQERKDKYMNTPEYGLIAQEVMQIFPELVDQDSATGYYSVKYTEFIPMLIDAFQRQQQQIETLQTDLSNCCQASGQRITSPGSQGDRATDPTSTNEQANWLAQNKPNPFSKETVIEYNIAQEGKGSILVFDLNGRLLKTIPVKVPGKGSVTITAGDLLAGMYYYTLVVNDKEVDTKKMILTE